ncbi:MAG: class I SAM-dependent methyltransferase [Sedimenticola sp.]|nr:class I SAM-dependent methyltransferase [Sedimenticola sp.]
MSNPDNISAHYGRQDLLERILAVLKQTGIDPVQLEAKQLYPVDQLHMGGRQATRELAEKLKLTSDINLLDVGSGLGGTARLLASEYGCQVTAIDLTESFCRASEKLTALTGLSNKIVTVQGDAVATGLPDAAFDLIWCQHTQMNIADKPGLLREFHRLLKPTGRVALHEVFAGSVTAEPIQYPLPWASDASASFLISADEMLTLATREGFELLEKQALSNEAQAWWEALLTRIGKAPGGGLGPGLIYGEQSRQFGPNIIDNLRHQRIAVYEMILRRP